MRGFLIALVVLVVLLVGIDFGARWVAEDRVATELQSQLKLDTEPDVAIHGFPFLTQAASGEYGSVTLTAEHIPYRQLQDITLTADLGDVTLPAQSLIDGTVRSIPAKTVTASAAIDPADLARVLHVSDVTVEPVTEQTLDERRAASATSRKALSGVDPAQAVALTSTTTVLGQSVRASVIATFKLSGGQIVLSARDISVNSGDTGDSGTVPSAVSNALRSRLSGFSARVDPGSLPFSITATDLRAQDGKLVVSGTAQNVDLLGGSL
jgi:LmeA-like phospholipid-binding